ncbi:hypothetical protein [Peptoniphilus indolicus]|uniref:Uncharacterized protein n=2 Tax=Peptoniphilus indolicus TaxID=33030 RepID=G4D361_9FIRM|nr:hypothetical protein [Peptoniphilus indolicus]EGY80043.1 hypothetical protein HMPREF9129_0841 [Peptoniphilus indolicus ATCC 29427]SUB75079.1 Uncharacterised protein [Peptoniphilus indolicus]
MKRYKLILLISCFIFIYGCKKTSNTFEKEDLKLFSNPILTYIENDKVVGEYFVNGKTELEEVTIDDFKSYIDENMDKIKSGEVGITDEGKFLIDKYLPKESEQLKGIDTKIEMTTGMDESVVGEDANNKVK